MYVQFVSCDYWEIYPEKVEKIDKRPSDFRKSIGSGVSWVAAIFKMERFVMIANGFQPLTIITKRSILDFAVALDLPLIGLSYPIFTRTKADEASQPISLEKKEFLWTW